MVFAHEVFWLFYLIIVDRQKLITSPISHILISYHISQEVKNVLTKNQFVSASQLCPWSPIVSLFAEKSSGKVVMDVCGARVEEG